MSEVLFRLAERIRYNADISARPGQYDDLNAIADEIERVAIAFTQDTSRC